MADELLHDANADGGLLGAELNPNCAGFGDRVRVRCRRREGVLLDHGLAGAGRKLHLSAAEEGVSEIGLSSVRWAGLDARSCPQVDSLRAAIAVGVLVSEALKRDLDFVFCQLVAL